MEKKAIYLFVSVALFVGLTVVSFSLLGEKETQASETPKVSSTPSKVMASNITPSSINPSAKPSNEESNGDVVIADLKAKVTSNEVSVEWTQPTMSNITNLRIIRTPSKPEGEGAVYNIGNSKGKFIDKSVKPGIRYYYEIAGKLGNSNVYSGIVFAEVEGKIQINTEDVFMTVNGEKKFYDSAKKSKSFVSGNTIMVPISSVSRVLGGAVVWVNENSKTNTKSAILKFRKSEVELFVGKKIIIVNKKEKQIDVAPIIKDDLLYAPCSVISDYMECVVNKTKDTITIDKPLNETENANIAKTNKRDINAIQGEVFEIELDDPTVDGKKWYYACETSDALVLKSKSIKDDKVGGPKSVLRFSPIKNGESKLIIKYFNPSLGEMYAEETLIYTIKVTKK